MNDDYDISDRWNGIGTHHDRFLSNSEMLFIGVGLWRMAGWYKENMRRLTPQEQAQYEIDVERWKAYLAWEASTPGAYEARLQYVADMEAEEAFLTHQADVAWRDRWAWSPLTYGAAIMVATDQVKWAQHGVNDILDYGEGSWWPSLGEAGIGIVAWWATRRLYRATKRKLGTSWAKARSERQEAERKALYQGSSPYLPVLWKPQP